MKILHLCLCGPVTDGYNYQENLLTKYQQRLGHQVSIICSKWIWNSQGKMELLDKSGYVNEDGVRMIRLNIIKGDFNNRLKRYEGLKEAIEAEEPDIIFSHGAACMDNGVIASYCKAHPDVTLYADSHADLTNSASNFISKHILHGIIWRHMAHVLEPCCKVFYGVLPARVEFLKDLYKLPEEKCRLLIMGADDDSVEEALKPGAPEALREKLGISPRDFLIVTGGKINSFRPEVLSLMRAVAQMQEKNIKLLFFGNVAEEFKEEFDSLCKAPEIINIGWIKSQDAYKYLAAADLAFFPGLHSVLWEQAAGVGVPCVFRKLKGFDHVQINGNCIFADDVSCEGISALIKRLPGSQEYEDLKKNALLAKSAFSYREIAAKAIGE